MTISHNSSAKGISGMGMFPRIFLFYTDVDRRAAANRKQWYEGQFDICHLTFLICHLELQDAFQDLDVHGFVDLNDK